MIRRLMLFSLVCVLCFTASSAQEAFNLPTELYVLLNEGRVQRYGLGAEGVSLITPEEQFVIDFGISPDGNWLAYRNTDALVVSEIATGLGQVMELNPGYPPVRGTGSTIAWSPDGFAIAYTTENGLRIAFRGEPPPVFVGVQDQGFSELIWSPDGQYIAAANELGFWQIYRVTKQELSLVSVTPQSTDAIWLNDVEIVFAPVEGGLVRMNLPNLNLQTPILPEDNIYDVMALRETGEITAYVQGGAVEEGFGVYTRINPFTGQADVVGEVAVELNGLQWTPQGELAIAFRGGALAFVNPVDGTGFALPATNSVAYDWGPRPLRTITGYPMTTNLFFIADSPTGIAQVWQLPQNGNPPLVLTRAESNVTGFAISPDGFTVAYSSDSRLWLQGLLSENAPFELTTLSSNASAMPDFRADGQVIAYVDNGIWTVPAAGGSPELEFENSDLTDDNSLDNRVLFNPRFARNSNALLVDILYHEGGSNGILDTTSGELLELPSGYDNGTWLYDGRIMTFDTTGAFNKPGLQISTINDFGNPQVILPDSVSIEDAILIPRTQREDIRVVVASDAGSGPATLRVYDFRDIAGLVPVVERGFVRRPQLSPDGNYVAGYAQTQQVGDDGQVFGQLTLVNLTTSEQVVLEEPAVVSQVRWQD